MDGHQGHYIRQYLVDAQSGCCAICGADGVWLGLPLALVFNLCPLFRAVVMRAEGLNR